MTDYVNASTGLKFGIKSIRRAHPNVSIPDGADLSSLGYAPLEETPKPDPIDAEHYVTPGPDEEHEPGQWRQTWVQEPIPPAPVPESISRLQARLALIDAGLWDSITAHFQDPDRTAVDLAFWEDAPIWRRDDPVIASAAPELGLTESQIDQLFIQAARL